MFYILNISQFLDLDKSVNLIKIDESSLYY